MTEQRERWFVVGLGRAGLPLARALADSGLLAGAWTRTAESAARADRFILDTQVADVPQIGDADIVLFAVPDDRIRRLALAVSSSAVERTDRVWLHTSGAHAGSIFASVGERSGSCHPLRSLTGSDDDLAALQGTYFALEGHPDAVNAGRRLAQLVGGVAAEVPTEAKVAYHLAAVLASNGVYALLAAAAEVCRAAGLDDPALAAGLARLAAGSAENAVATPLAQAATGPVIRGDATTVRAHLEWLRAHRRDVVPLYAELSELLIELAEQTDRVPESSLAAVRALLAQSVDP